MLVALGTAMVLAILVLLLRWEKRRATREDALPELSPKATRDPSPDN